MKFCRAEYKQASNAVRPNPSVEARPNGRPPGPGWWYAYIFTSPGLASFRWPRLTSNVRHHTKHDSWRLPALKTAPLYKVPNRRSIYAIAGLFGCALAHGQVPACAGTDRWPTSSALVQLKSAGIATGNEVDVTKTKTTLLASERIGNDLFRQVHFVVFTERSGRKIEVITSNEASSAECSMSAVQLFVVSRRLGGQ